MAGRKITVIVRTRYADPTSDAVQDFPSRADAEAHLTSLGFVRKETIGWVSYYQLTVKNPTRNEDVQLAGYLAETPA